jgi:hypothetical protein
MKKLVLPLIALFACTTASVASSQDACEPGTHNCCLCTTRTIGTCVVKGSANKATCFCKHQGYMVKGTASKCGK